MITRRPPLRRPARLVLVLACAACAAQNSQPELPNGTLLTSEPIRITTAYDNQSELIRFRFPRNVNERAAHDDRFVAPRVTFHAWAEL